MKRVVAAVVALVTLLLAVFVVVGVNLFVFPAVDAPQKTDVVFVIGPPTPTRIALAETLMNEGYSSNLLISTPQTGELAAVTLDVCMQKRSYAVYCATPSPFTTQGEARYLRDMSAEHGWTSATVITFTPHVTRARIIMQRCFTGTLAMVPDRSDLLLRRWVYEFFYQSTALVKAETDPQC